MARIIIIGNGISGITAARHIRKLSDAQILVISGETDHFFSRTALMYIYMGHMQYAHTKPYEDFFWKKNRIDLKRGWVEHVDTGAKSVQMEDGSAERYDQLVIATGSSSNMFGWPGQDLQGVQGLYSYQDLEEMEANTKGIQHAVVVGGGLIGVEMVEMLHTRGIHVSFLVREENFWNNILPVEEGNLIKKHILEQGVDLQMSTELDSIVDDGTGRVAAIVTKNGERIDCQFVGLTVGVHPNIKFLEGSGINTDKGVLVNEHLETNVKDVYSIGDCAQFQKHPDPERRSIEQVWYTGRMMGETVAETLCGTRTPYRPGNWFNSAKFFDIEYQTYGWVRNNAKDDEETFYWEHPNGKICFRATWERQTRRLRGINVFGLRLRHERFDHWQNTNASVDTVIECLHEANFDPELYRDHIKLIQHSFKKQAAAVST